MWVWRDPVGLDSSVYGLLFEAVGASSGSTDATARCAPARESLTIKSRGIDKACAKTRCTGRSWYQCRRCRTFLARAKVSGDAIEQLRTSEQKNGAQCDACTSMLSRSVASQEQPCYRSTKNRVRAVNITEHNLRVQLV